MKEGLTKKIIIIVSVVSAVVLTFVILAFATGNTYYPSLSNPDEIFYQRLDDQGNVIYTITNKDVYEEIKSNNGIQQLIYMTDSMLLSDYITQVTQDQIDNKLLELTYGTSDPDEIADIKDKTKSDMETQFAQQMLLGGFKDHEDEYARLLVARELYAKDKADEDEQITDYIIGNAYLNNYFDDISAIKIRFTSEDDAKSVMQLFNLFTLSDSELREYNGYIYDNETILDPDDNIVEAYIPVDAYYFTEDDDIAKADGTVMYELGANNIYYREGKTFNIDAGGNFVDSDLNVIIPTDHLFDTQDEAVTYKNDNTQYFTVTKTDPYDMNETSVVKDNTDAVIYTINSDGHIFDNGDNDVTYTTDLVVNKIYTAIEDVTTPTVNNTSELTDEEILVKYIEMYNYVYGVYRDLLPTDKTDSELASLNNEYINFNYDAEADIDSSLATYMFKTLSIQDENRFSVEPQSFGNFYYMVYKLTEGTKTDIMSTIFGYVAPLITIPTQIGSDIELPYSTYYDGTITWQSTDASVISSTGVVTTPTEDTEVVLDYTIKIFGETYDGSITVTVLADGETQEVTEPTWDEVSLKTIINDDTVYNDLYNKLLDDYIYGNSGADNVNKAMLALRTDLGFTIYDHFVGLDYQQMDSTFELNKKGDKTILASFDHSLTSDNPITITADDFFEYALTKNAALYTLYANQYYELLNSDYFTLEFGTQKDLTKNKSDGMDEMYASVENAKQYYTYLQRLYSNYGLAFNYSSFIDYAYIKYGTKTELDLLQYFVEGKLQPYFIHETLSSLDSVDMIYDTVQDNFDNYFSLNVSQLLVYIDFDEDGKPDDFNDYKDQLTPAEITDFETLEATLEQAVSEYDGSFSDLITEYNNASRDDDTWGVFKQNGLFLLTEDLNKQDKDDSSKTHSLTYSGDYGVKDSYVPEFVDALIDLYDEYQLPQNEDLDELQSDAVSTQFGLHFILVTPGENFEKPTCNFTEDDPSNPQYTVGSENNNDAPTLEQMQLYSLYKFYSSVYDLTDTDIEDKYGITIPNLPLDVIDALDFYMGNLVDSFYVFGTLNVNIIDKIESGEFQQNSYTQLSNNDLMAMLEEIKDVYYDAVFGDYITN